MDNDKESIDQLFQDAIDAFGGNVLPGTKAMFEKLANITLKYRDELVAKGEPFLTVVEVKEALDDLQAIISTGSFPQDIPPRLKQLLERWVLMLTPKGKKQ
jgi:hypothetical protein